jgi:hypothetical protein
MAASDSDPYLKIFASLALFEKNPGENKSIFIKALPNNKIIQYNMINDRYLAVDIIDPELENSNPSIRVNGFAVFNAAARLAIGGNPTALLWCWSFKGFSSAEDTEGQTEWQSNVFNHPELILANWEFFKDKLDSCQLISYLEPQEMLELKERYKDAFYYHPYQYNIILRHLSVDDQP